MELTNFYPPHDPYVRELCEKAAILSRDETATLNRPQDIVSIAKLALYDTIIYCGMCGRLTKCIGPANSHQMIVSQCVKMTEYEL